MRKKGGKRVDLLVFLLQLGTLALFIFAVVLSLYFHPVLVVVAVALFALNSFTLLKKLRKVRNRNAYLYFFGGLNLLGITLVSSKFMVKGFNIVFILGFIIIFAAFLVAFQVFFRKNHVFGTVLAQDGEWAVVQVSFDLCSGVGTGFYAVKTRKKLKKGEEVKMSVERPFGERAFPWRIED